MRSLPAFLMAFIVTVVICGILMIGCGGTGTSTGGAVFGNNNSTMTGNNNGKACSKDGELCVANSQCCNNSCYGGVGNPQAPGATDYDYRCQQPPAGTWGAKCNPPKGGPYCADGFYCLIILDDPNGGTCVANAKQ
jgi:hypothetical protein